MENVETFSNLLKLNEDCLKQHTESTYLPVVAPKELVPGLLKLQKLRMLTVYFQRFEVTKPWWHGDKIISTRLRPYICFLIADEDKPLKLVNRLKERSDILVHAISPPFQGENELDRSKWIFGNELPSKLDKCVYQYRSASSEEGLVKEAWSDVFSLVFLLKGMKSLSLEQPVSRFRPWVILVWAPMWEVELDVAGVIAEVAEEVSSNHLQDESCGQPDSEGKR